MSGDFPAAVERQAEKQTEGPLKTGKNALAWEPENGMERRAFLACLVGGVGLGIRADSVDFQQPLVPEYAFDLAEPSDEVLIEATGSLDVIYALIRRIPSKQHSIVCAKYDGTLLWTRGLSEGFYSQLNTKRSGGFTLVGIRPGAGRKVLEFDAAGSELGAVDLPGAVLASCTIGDGFLAVGPDGSLIVRALSSSAGTGRKISDLPPPRGVGGFVPPLPVPSIEPILPDKVFVVDKTSAQFCRVAVPEGRIEATGFIEAPEIERSVKVYTIELQDRQQIKTRRGTPLIPGVIHATATNRAGKVYCMPSPVAPRTPLVFELDESGAVLRRLRCSVPDRESRRAKIPFHMGVSKDRLFFAFPDGDVLVYRL